MNISTQHFELKTKGNTEIIDITEHVQSIIDSSNYYQGNALIFIGGSTAAITSIEYEPGLLKDYPKFFENIIPSNKNYEHDNTWHDGNGHSHIRAALQGASFTVPFLNGKLLLGTWQQIILIDFDNRPRNRKIIIQLTGEKKNEK